MPKTIRLSYYSLTFFIKFLSTYLIVSAYLSLIHKQATVSSRVGSESANSMDVDGHNGEDLGGTDIDNIHGSNQHSENNALCDDAA